MGTISKNPVTARLLHFSTFAFIKATKFRVFFVAIQGLKENCRWLQTLGYECAMIVLPSEHHKKNINRFKNLSPFLSKKVGANGLRLRQL